MAKLFWSLCALCAVLFVADAFYDKHAYFGIEEIFGFYGILGFAACVGLAGVARLFHRLVGRREDYYD